MPYRLRQNVEFCEVLFTQSGDTSNLWAGNLEWMVETETELVLISNFRGVPNAVFSLLGDSPASEFYVPMFRNTLSVPSA